MRNSTIRAPLVAAILCMSICVATEAKGELPRPIGETEGFILEAGFGGNGLTDDDYVERLMWLGVDIDPLIGLFIAGYYRFIPNLSIGMVAHFAFLEAHSHFEDEFSGFFALLIETRGHLPIGRVDPWIGLGLGYATAFSTAEENSAWGDFNGSLSLHGVGLSIGIGINIYVTPKLAVAPFFRIIFGLYPSGCYEFDNNDECEDLEELYGVADEDDLPDRPHLWTVGVLVSYTL